MRILQVVSSVDDPAAGTTYALNRLCETLGARGLDVELHTLEPLPESLAVGYERLGYPRWVFPARLGVSGSMRATLREAAMRADVVHNNGLWMMPNIYAGSAARRAGRPQVYSVHGMLAPWALSRSRWKKTLVGWAGQTGALAGSACFHATAASEYEEIRQLGYRQPVAIVPYGIDIPLAVSPIPGQRRRLLFLSRIHPKKGVDVLLRSWREVQGTFLDWDLLVCGPDNEGHLQAMQQLAETLGVQRVEFLGPRYGKDKESIFNSCDLFVLPTYNENFGFVVAEALSHGKPAIVTTAAPWQGLEHHRCGWWIQTGHEALKACLSQALALPAGELSAMGRRGREWMIRDLSWVRVGEMMDITYQWLLGRVGRPGWIEVE